ncbi:SCO family protein [Helicobacter fennelliae]|uniref:Cytochrome oxidase biogenesis protein Sco1/SenC/PrrC, putative copper metallochaperone n=1 Tax=Helicobacter fennelliae MRY12-0050 TaxID=1325130 RepID=T1D0X5_9HELI|nr:SCO family protein [Helicobacter fennelliae]GAD19865.1 cytochrome oxidase biogenesis protein Sco1/SenC/PrrC, putative copper metallochaperone [Helicobacter fennelliae MRY12-0050]STP08049.1 SCO1/SenC [Helicobacter fennelliae]STQ84042.1 SCO1/SenC [Helicobacter fennelliae]
MKKFFGMVVGICVLGLAVWGFYCYKNSSKFDFSAQSIHGTIKLSDFKNQRKIVYFGYMSCPDVCPMTFTLLSLALQESRADDIALFFVSLDPQRDDVKSLDRYAKYFYPNAYGLSLSQDELDVVTARYGVKYQRILLDDSALDYSIAHSSSLYLLDSHARLIGELSNLTYEEILGFIGNARI